MIGEVIFLTILKHKNKAYWQLTSVQTIGRGITTQLDLPSILPLSSFKCAVITLRWKK